MRILMFPGPPLRSPLQCIIPHESTLVADILLVLSRRESSLTHVSSLHDHIVHQIRNFVDKYYQFVEGVAQYQRDIDELLGKVSRPQSILLVVANVRPQGY